MATHPNNTRYVFNFNVEEDGWDDDMVNTMDRLDREVHQQGSLADRPGPTTEQAPNWYYVNDTNTLYHNDGAAWVQRTDTHVRNAVAFTDSAATGGAAIQSAIDDLPAEGGTVIVPSQGSESDSNGNARWELSGHISLRSNLKLIGHDASLFLQNASDDHMLATNTAEGDPLVENVVIEGFSMDANRANNSQWTRPDGTAVNPACVWCLESDDVTVRDCSFASSVGYGVKFALSTRGTVDGCYATDMGDDGFTVTDTKYSSATSAYNTFHNCRSENNLDAGFEVDDGAMHTKFVGCESIGNVEGFDAHTHASNAPDSWQNVYYLNCSSINNEFGWKLGANNTGTPGGVYARNIYAEGSSTAAFSAGNSGNTSDSVPNDVEVNGFVFEHPGSASAAAIDLRSPNGVSGWTFSDGTIRTGRRAVDGDQAVENLTLQNVECDVSAMTIAESGIELNAGSSGFIRDIEIIGCSVSGAQNSGLQLWTGGGDLSRVRIMGGSYYDNGQGNTASSGGAGISINNNGAAPSEFSVIGVNCTDTQGTATQVTGIWWDGVASSAFVGNVLIGNGTNSTDGALAASSATAANIT